MILIVLLATFAVAVNGKAVTTGVKQTEFYKCHKLSLTNKDLCFDAVLHKVKVYMGSVGTNDDVFLNVCSDFDASNCCKTPALSTFLHDDWSKNDNETWKESSFGNQKKGGCEDKVFKVKGGLQVTLSKSGNDKMIVNRMDITTRSPKKEIKDQESFLCGGYTLEQKGSQANTLSKNCKTGPYHYSKIEGLVAKVGPDGTNDNVFVKVCSDVNDFCCEDKVARPLLTFNDNWSKNDVENFKASDFGDCAKKQYKIKDKPRIVIRKDGSNSLKVLSFQFLMKTQDQSNKVTRYNCPGFEFKNDCTTGSNTCVEQITTCKP